MNPGTIDGRGRQQFSPVAAWVLLCAVLNAAGWLLSIPGWLNRAGYAFVFFAGIALAGGWAWRNRIVLEPGFRWSRLRRRFRRPIPLAFAVVALLALLGGAVHAPNNYDALTYRLPRVLHWLAEGQWHWAHTDFQRLNTRSCGIEWVSAPLLLLGQMRLLFLINAVSFLLLPGLTFSLLSRLGVRRRVAWVWMWILPAGYCYVLQAGSIANDLFGATFAMAAVDYALRASKQRSATAGWIAMMAAGLMTAAKPFNLVLLLPWGLALLPATLPMIRRPVGTVFIAAVALLASLAPTAFMNVRYCGDWTGLKAEPVLIAGGAPGLRLGVNTVLVTLHNLTPTFFPVAGQWNRAMDRMIPEEAARKLHFHFEDGAARFVLGEMPMEELTGLGFGVSVLLLTVLIQRPKWRGPAGVNWRAAVSSPANYVPAATWLVTIYYLTQIGLACPARYLAPWYALLVVPLLRSAHADGLLRRLWWRRLALATFGLAALLVLVTPARPLWPAKPVLRALGADTSSGLLLSRAWKVYSVYGERADGFAPVREALPPGLGVLGLVAGEDPETSLWRPFGSRRILHVPASDDAASLRRRGIEYVLVSGSILDYVQKVTYAQWLERYECEETARFDLSLKAAHGPTRWYLVRVRPGRPDAAGRTD